jgi:hypothetical protein
MKRKIKSDPALNIDEIKTPFPLAKMAGEGGVGDAEEEEEDVVPGDAIAEMWTFGSSVIA